MKAIVLRAPGAAFLLALAGCGSMKSVDPSQYASMSCPEIETAVGETSKAISAAGVSRGKINQLNLPFWVPGGEKAVSILRDRRTAEIERLQSRQQAILAARNQRCPNS